MNKRQLIVDIEKSLDRELLSVYRNAYDDIIRSIEAHLVHGQIPPTRLISLKNKIEDTFVGLNQKVPIVIDNTITGQVLKIMGLEKTELQKSLFALSPALKVISLDSPAITEPFIRNILRSGIDGVPISSRIWVYGNQIKRKLITTVGNYVAQGMSAEQLIPSLKPFLLEPKGYGAMNGLVKRFRTLANKYVDIDPAKYRELIRKSRMIDASIPRVGRGVYRSAYKNAWRLSVTEFNNACHQTNIEYYKSLPFVSKVKWNLNPIGHHCEVCLSYAGKEFDKNNVPEKPHPICRCFLTSVNDKEYLKQKYGI